MIERKEKYINPFTDYGFKRLFGEEPSKDLLLDFLNELLGDKEGKIKELSYQPNDSLPTTVGNRKAIFDIYCINEKGEHFIVEMQKVEQQFFKDRMLFYSTFPIQNQAKDKGKDWNFNLKHVYAIGILDFAFKEDQSDPDKYRYDAKITEIETGKIFFDKLTFTYLSMEKFNKKLDELETKFEKWLFVIKNLNKLDRIPENLKEEIFIRFFQIAEIAKLGESEYREYEASLNAYRDIKNSVDWAEEKGIIKGKKEGRKEEKIEIALKLIDSGMDHKEVNRITGLSIEEIEELRKKNNR